MNVLIVGGSGFVSGTLARAALEQGDRVWTVTRGSRRAPEGAISLTADRKDPLAFRAAIERAGVRWDLAVDCICFVPEDMRQDLEVLPGLAKHFVFISTDFVFDPEHRVFPQPEESEHYLSEGYGGNKRACELLLESGAPAELRWTVFRPCHIYGPGSQLGCLPAHSRDPDLLERIRRGEPLRLVGGGHFLQQPILARDLARLILAAPECPGAACRIFCAAGPDIVESRRYYEIIARAVGTTIRIEEIPVSSYRTEHPEHASFLCHRIYDLDALGDAGLPVPATPLADGLREHVRSLSG